MKYSKVISNEVLTVRDAARHLQVVEKTVVRLIHRKELPATKVGRVWRIKRSWLEEWLGKGAGHSHGKQETDAYDAMILRLKERILAEGKNKIRRMMLYGSRARGTARPDSDLDLLVVEKDPVSKRQERERLRQAVGDFSVPIDIRVMGETEFQETKNIVGGVAYPAYKEGILLYEVA